MKWMSFCVKIIIVSNVILFNTMRQPLFLKEQLITEGTVFVEPPVPSCGKNSHDLSFAGERYKYAKKIK